MVYTYWFVIKLYSLQSSQLVLVLLHVCTVSHDLWMMKNQVARHTKALAANLRALSLSSRAIFYVLPPEVTVDFDRNFLEPTRLAGGHHEMYSIKC